ncbi:PH domain-containing protein [Actinopolyspora mortivallis]|uniref:PH domain-containing protein n=1 Tax=Actinopolyspora mortivallis TaxID=33906 RepID=UPI00037D3F10|nr:PH domain-containing protein [Actinopolyspora mortivallis]
MSQASTPEPTPDSTTHDSHPPQEEAEAATAGRDSDDQHTDSAPESTDSGSDPAEEDALPENPRMVFRFTRVAVLVILVVAVGISPAAMALPWLSVLYVIPLGLLYWIFRIRTVVDRSGVTARTLFRTRHLEWSEIRALSLDERRWVRAVTDTERGIVLPVVRVRDLPRLSVLSGGRIRDPLATTPPETDDSTS